MVPSKINNEGFWLIYIYISVLKLGSLEVSKQSSGKNMHMFAYDNKRILSSLIYSFTIIY